MVDWGLAKPFERGEAAAPAARRRSIPGSRDVGPDLRTRGLAGTPAYMSPEQADDHRRDSIGPASDISNLGATLYALLTGRPPFQGGLLARCWIRSGGATSTPARSEARNPPRTGGDLPEGDGSGARASPCLGLRTG